MNKISLMNQYVANLAVFNVKLHNLHWNVVGAQFMAVHKMTEALYEAVFEQFDSVAEQIKILGETPVSTLKEYLDLATLKELPAEPVSSDDVRRIVRDDLKDLIGQAEAVRKTADEEGDFLTVSLFEELAAFYRKNIWFLSASLS